MSVFVPFKTAKKLKEKGFPQHICDDGYITEEDDKYDIGDKEMIWFIPDYLPYIAAPIVSQVLKWLRDEKKIHICISYSDNINTMWEYEIILLDGALYQNAGSTYMSYEQAALAGIESVLDNLI